MQFLSGIKMLIFFSHHADEFISNMEGGHDYSNKFLTSQMNSKVFSLQKREFIFFIFFFLVNYSNVGHNIFVISEENMENFCSRTIVRSLGKDSRLIKPFGLLVVVGGAVDFRKVLVRIANLFIYKLSKYILSACNQKTLKWTLGKQEWSHHTWVLENPVEDTSHCVQCLQSLPWYNKANTEQAHLIYCWDQGKFLNKITV